MIVARQFPRDEKVAIDGVLESCSEPAFAETALFRYPRGGTEISGASVDLAREIARVWGNMDSGFRVISMTEEEVHIEGYATDFETNCRKTQEHRFARKVQKKGKGYVLTDDEREIRELIGREGSRLERNCILRIVPAHLVSKAVERCNATSRRVAQGGDPKATRETTVATMIKHFGGLGVTREMLERRVGRKAARFTDADISGMREMAAMLQSGEAEVWDYWPETAPEQPDSGVDVEQPADDPDESQEAAAVEDEPPPGAVERAADGWDAEAPADGRKVVTFDQKELPADGRVFDLWIREGVKLELDGSGWWVDPEVAG